MKRLLQFVKNEVKVVKNRSEMRPVIGCLDAPPTRRVKPKIARLRHRAQRIQCVVADAVPSDHLSARTSRIVTRSCGSFTIMTGELGSSAAQLFVMSPGEKNMVWERQALPWSFKYCCFDI